MTVTDPRDDVTLTVSIVPGRITYNYLNLILPWFLKPDTDLSVLTPGLSFDARRAFVIYHSSDLPFDTAFVSATEDAYREVVYISYLTSDYTAGHLPEMRRSFDIWFIPLAAASGCVFPPMAASGCVFPLPIPVAACCHKVIILAGARLLMTNDVADYCRSLAAERDR